MIRLLIAKRQIKISDKNIVFLVPRSRYKTIINEEFEKSKIYTWKEFHLLDKPLLEITD